ncbi:MAG TPA: hypothetical protein VJZ00_00135 [Thermoanaerobaculia bacterium]|nr:hypothetical protein [Thermoanaerobaculia bacterium]
MTAAVSFLFDFVPPAPAPAAPSAPAIQRDEVARLRASLAGTAAAKMMNASELIRALDKDRHDGTIPTTLSAFDSLLGGGLPRGKMIELVGGRRAAGRFSIAIAALASATSMGEAAVLIDLGDHFAPRVAEAAGVDLRRVLWIRPKTLKHAVMSAEMITATGFQLVILDLGLPPLRGKRVPDAAWIRLARSAEAHGTALLVSSPYPLTGTASEAVVKTANADALWIVRKQAPNLLDGVDAPLALEKHRHLKPDARATLTLAMLP